MNPTVFISYARIDGEDFARNLRESLERAGIGLWQDRMGLEGGQDWWLQISEVIDAVEFMVLVMTPAAAKSPTVGKEWRYARQQGVCVYPVKGVPNLDFTNLPRWMRDSHFYDLGFDVGHFESGPEWRKLVNDLMTRCDIQRVPFMCDDLPNDFVPRPNEFEKLISQLLDSGRQEPIPITLALKGAGGYGKTTLARAICHDEHIQQAFDDGILWVTLGTRVENLTAKVDDLVYVLSGKRSDASSIETATSELVRLLEDRDLLIVIDDVWHVADLRPFLQGGKRCARLITTRNTNVLPTDALANSVLVDAMLPAEALALLGAGLEGTEAQAVRLKVLMARLGKWALLMKLVNGALRGRGAAGQPLNDALTHIERALDEGGLTVFDDVENYDQRNRAVAVTLSVSLTQLSGAERASYSELAIFPADADVPLAALEKLWGATHGLSKFRTEQFCERLFKLSLLLNFDPKLHTIRLHDMVRTYLVEQTGAITELHGKFLDAYGITSWLDLPEDEPYLWERLAYHLLQAGRGEQLIRQVLDLRYIARKIWLRSTVSVEIDLAEAEKYAETYDTSEIETLRLLRRQIANNVHILDRCETLDDLMIALRT